MPRVKKGEDEKCRQCGLESKWHDCCIRDRDHPKDCLFPHHEFKPERTEKA